MRRVIDRTQRMSHRMRDAKADVGEAHAGDILAQRHAFAAFLFIGHGAAQRTGDDLNGLKMEHVGHFPGCLGRIAFNGMGQRIHAGRGSEPLWHRCHHIRIDDRDHRHIVRIHTDKFAFSLHIGDDIVDGHFRGGAGRGRYRDDRYAGLACRGSAFQAAHILELRVRDDDTDRFGRIHRRSAADGDDIVGTSSLERGNALLHIFDGRISLDVRIDLIGKGSLIEDIGHFSGHSKADQVRIGADKGFLISS